MISCDLSKTSDIWNLGVGPDSKLLKKLGPVLQNSRNNCWYHAGLCFLSQAWTIRKACVKYQNNYVSDEVIVARAVLAVCGFDNIVYVEKAFNIVKDFTGRQFRYRQLSLSDFVDYLLLKFPTIFNSLCTSITTTLTCMSCGWLSSTVP